MFVHASIESAFNIFEFLATTIFHYSDCILAAAKDTFSKARKAMTKTLKKWLRSIVLFFNM